MAKFDVYDLDRKKVSELELADAVFAGEVNEHLFYEVVKAKLASDRSGTHAVKNRSLVSGGGKKPWKQKGTGRARQGSTRASQWVGGGKAMGPKPRDYSLRRAEEGAQGGAALGAVAARPATGSWSSSTAGSPRRRRPRPPRRCWPKLGAARALVVDGPRTRRWRGACATSTASDFLATEGLNVYDILKHEALVLTPASAKALEANLS